MKDKRRFVGTIVIVGLFFSLTSCFSSGVSISTLKEEIASDNSLASFYESTTQQIDLRFANSAFKGNFAEWQNNDTIKFSDNTVYLGNALAWRAATLGFEDKAKVGSALQAIVDQIVDQLTVRSKLPDGSDNFGYFLRDNMTETQLTLPDKVWNVQSDAQNGDDNQMSQDQLVHVIYGYWNAVNYISQFASSEAWAPVLINKIKSHAHEIGIRLKAFNYKIVDPSGAEVKRGADARGFAWPIAETIAEITGNPISTYLTSVKAIDEKRVEFFLSAEQLKDLFLDAISGLTTGICSLKVGADQRELCNRFTIRMINALYITSGAYKAKIFYTLQMEKDQDFLGALQSRILRNEKIPAVYLDTLNSALATKFQCDTGPVLWCQDYRWIRLPSSCPDVCDSANLYRYSGLDFAILYAVSRAGR